MQAFKCSYKPFIAVFLTLTLFLFGGCTTLVAIGNVGEISENYGERTWGGYIDDKLIRAKISTNLDRQTPPFQQADIQVNSYNGVVLLTGYVPNKAERLRAYRVAEKTRKVRRIHNELEIGPEEKFNTGMADFWIKRKLNSRLRFTSGIESGRVKTVVQNKAVYLMGLMSREEADRVVAATQKVSGISKIVKAFEYIDDAQGNQAAYWST